MLDVISWAAVLVFSLAAAANVRDASRPEEQTTAVGWWLTGLGVLLMGYVYINHVLTGRGLLEVGLSHSLDLMVLVTATIYLLGGRGNTRLNRSVGMVLLPILALLLLVARLIPEGQEHARKMADPSLVAHLLFSVVAYGLFSLAAVLALLDGFQEHALRKKSLGRFYSQMPSLDRLEEKLFSLVRWGFGLLTLSMASGAGYSHQTIGVWFAFSHKVIFIWATWLVFGVLLLGHHFQGWRGRRAVRYVLIGYILLWLGYFGVKMVSELLLHR